MFPFVNQQQLENEIQQYEAKLRELTDKGEILLTLDPQTPAISTELSLLQTNWEDLLKQANIKRQQLNKAKIIQVKMLGNRILTFLFFFFFSSFFEV